MKGDEIRGKVRGSYAEVAKGGGSCCGSASPCCGGSPAEISRVVGYGEEDLAAVPSGADLGLGCGNPVALAGLREGETVLDLGCGAGLDCFIAARRVGPQGRVIGVDMTPEMLERARRNAEEGGFSNVEFRLGEIENLPVRDGEADVVISNCVINLSPDKRRVFREAWRALRPGGRLMVSDMALRAPLPPEVASSKEAWCACVAGALQVEDYLEAIRDAGFERVEVAEESDYPLESSSDEGCCGTVPAAPSGMASHALREAAPVIKSVRVRAVKPA